MSGLRPRHRDRARPAAQTGPWEKTDLDSGSPGYLEVLWADLHDSAGLVAAQHTVQLGNPPAKRRLLCLRRGVGRGRAAARRPGPESRRLHATEVVRAATVVTELLGAVLPQDVHLFPPTHHPCLGLAGSSPYSGPGEPSG